MLNGNQHFKLELDLDDEVGQRLYGGEANAGMAFHICIQIHTSTYTY
jgi:hypothetical protein